MPVLHARIYKLSIPFKMTFSHAEASRSECDSFILETSMGMLKGYGELILRPYVNDLKAILDTPEKIIHRISFMLNEVTAGNSAAPSLERLHELVFHPQWEKQDLPLLAAVESALLDLICRQQDKDVYTLLSLPPKREELIYGGILPILSNPVMDKILMTYKQMSIPYLRIKLAKDYEYNRHVLSRAREILGKNIDIRVDVNCAWDVETALGQLDLLTSFGVTMIEEPMGADHKKMMILSDRTREKDIVFVADESAVSFADFENIIKDKTFAMLNLRIAKNGGLLRVLELSNRAETAGLRYQLGSHVGETGILSVIGRIAASLMEKPAYIDGSFDEYILSDNITLDSYTFGRSGLASIIRGKYLGYTVDSKKLGKGTVLL